MNVEVKEGHQAAQPHQTLVVKVRYIASNKPFVDPDASPKETLAAFKQRALAFFALGEGAANGGTKTYHLAVDGVVLTDLSASLEATSQGKHELKLDLIERFEQG